MKICIFRLCIYIIISIIKCSSYYSAKRTRYTKDGRKCSESFKVNENTYTDCVLLRTPDGVDKKEEWCYVEHPEKGASHWDYCIPILDYDYIREQVYKDIESYNKQKNELSIEVKDVIIKTQKIINQYKKSSKRYDSIKYKIPLLLQKVVELRENIKFLFVLKDNWEKKEKEIQDAKKAIEKYKKEFEEEREEEDSNNFESINDIEEEEKIYGEGLKAYYYNNEMFEGKSIIQYKTQSSIDFDWTGIPPIENINNYLFSVIFIGYIEIPKTGKYTFSIVTEDKASLSINEDEIINTFNSNNSKNTAILYLTGGEYYFIKIKFSHAFYDHPDERISKTFLILKWSSTDIPESQIPLEYFYNELPTKKIGISSTNPDIKLTKVSENGLAFSDDESYIIQDIPDVYIGLTMMQLPVKYAKNNLEFTLTNSCEVYFGFLISYPFPFPPSSPSLSYSDTNTFISILEVEPNCTKGESKRSSLFRIYKTSLQSGKHSLPLSLTDANTNGISMIMFIGENHQNTMQCGGVKKTIQITQCSSSSEYDARFKCENAFKGTSNEEVSEWGSLNEGVGAWIKAEFDEMNLITEIKYRNRKSSYERNSKIQFEFSNGIQRTFDIPNDYDVHSLQINPPIMSSSVKMIIISVYSSLNNGGQIDIIGTKCLEKISIEDNDDFIELISNSQSPSLFQYNKDQKNEEHLQLTCIDSLLNIPMHKVNSSYIIECNDNCIYSELINIYGNKVYSEDSSICKALTHSKGGNSLKAILFVTKGQNYYDSSTANHITSFSKGYSDFSYEFADFSPNVKIDLVNGEKIDYYNINESKWKSGIISKVISIHELVVKDEHSNNKIYISNPLYNETTIALCGYKVQGRKCNKEKKIIFSQDNSKAISDILISTGEKISNTQYGFNINMKNRIKTRSTQQLSSFIAFNPSQKSIWCKDMKNSDINCEIETVFYIKVGRGRFQVELLSYDEIANSIINFSINNYKVASSVFVPKNTKKSFTATISAINDFLIIKAECENKCNYAMSKLNMIKINKIDYDTEVEYSECELKEKYNELHYVSDSLEKMTMCKGDGKYIVQITDPNYKCKNLIGMYKCVRRNYDTIDECNRNCPFNCNSSTKCESL